MNIADLERAVRQLTDAGYAFYISSYPPYNKEAHRTFTATVTNNLSSGGRMEATGTGPNIIAAVDNALSKFPQWGKREAETGE